MKTLAALPPAGALIRAAAGWAALAALAAALLPAGAPAQESRASIRGSNLEIPRFVTLKASLANMRAGPGKDYPIKWQYRRVGLPLKVVGEFEVWRKVEDHEGETGWMNVNMLTIRRMALVSESTEPIRSGGGEGSPVVAVAERGVILELEACDEGWCRVAGGRIRGWIRRDALWGILDGEAVD